MPAGEAARVVVWRVGDALLAVPLAAAVEIAAVASDGKAVSRAGRLEIRTPPGIPHVSRCPRAVVVRAGPTGGELVALAAEAVEGVKAYAEKDAAVTPEWLRGLSMAHVAGLIRVDDRRVAALLAVDALAGE